MNKRYIEVVPYNHTWPLAFEVEAARIKRALGDNCIEVHHIGSTSIPGLSAKPIIDMLPVVRNIAAVNEQAMEALGYEAKGEFGIPFRRFFSKNPDLKTYNVHVFEHGNSEIDRHLKFANWMRNNPKDKDAYAILKENLAKKFPNDIESYCIGKDEFIANIDAKAGWDGFRFVVAITPKEWEAYHRISNNHPISKLENHYNFVLYKGKNIVSIARVELLSKGEANIKFIATDEQYKESSYGLHMMQLIEKWIKIYE